MMSISERREQMKGLIRKSYSEEEARALELQWLELVRTGTFSEGVVGVGEFRLFGRTGDTPGTYPQIRSLAVLQTLLPAELYALQMIATAAETVIGQGQTLVAVPQGRQLGPEDYLSAFDATQICIYAVPRVVGG
jgi:hypothetical protein